MIGDSTKIVGETIWIVMAVASAAIPVAWRMTEDEANAVRDSLAAQPKVLGDPNYFFVLSVTNT